jgi:hypothetical protein
VAAKSLRPWKARFLDLFFHPKLFDVCDGNKLRMLKRAKNGFANLGGHEDCSSSILAIVPQTVDGGSFHKRLWFTACLGVGAEAEKRRGWCRGKAVGVPRKEEKDHFFMLIWQRRLCRERLCFLFLFFSTQCLVGGHESG